jgi:glycosyltransferase involved in cell wall biosynthesis
MLAPLALRIVEKDRKRFQLAFGRVLCVSEAIRQAMLAQVAALDPARVQVVHNGIDLAAFPFAARGAMPAGQTGGLRLLYAGSLVPHKGVHVAIDAVGELARQGLLRGMQLTIVGSGRPDYEAALRRAVTEQGLEGSVRFAGRVPRSEMPAQLAAHDVLIFPSEWPEPLARMTQEAMACGAVVVGTITGGTGEILADGETGLVFPPGDAPALARCIQRLQMDRALFGRLAQGARRRVEEKFSFERMLDQVEVALGEVASALMPEPGGARP